GFKTFILTLVVSLLVFSALYVVINEDSSAETLGVEEKVSSDVQMQGSVFEELVNQEVETEPRAVLAGTDTADTTTPPEEDTTPESTVPDTGISGPTLGILLTTGLLAIAWYLNTRPSASFEKRVLKELD
ncbi:hypothetical protein ACFL13_01670, partial [Patescibacteria group bacterium]